MWFTPVEFTNWSCQACTISRGMNIAHYKISADPSRMLGERAGEEYFAIFMHVFFRRVFSCNWKLTSRCSLWKPYLQASRSVTPSSHIRGTPAQFVKVFFRSVIWHRQPSSSPTSPAHLGYEHMGSSRYTANFLNSSIIRADPCAHTWIENLPDKGAPRAWQSQLVDAETKPNFFGGGWGGRNSTTRRRLANPQDSTIQVHQTPGNDLHSSHKLLTRQP